MAATTTPLPIRQSRGQYIVPSKSEIGLVHVVRQCRGEWECDCTAAVHGQGCWHARAVAKAEARREFSPEVIRPGLDLLMGRSPKPAA